MFVHSLDPVFFSVGPITVYWYGLVYVLGFVALYWALLRVADLSSEKADSLVVWAVIGLFLGARSFFFLFYRPDLFSITEFFAVWRGGMSFHGGLAGLFVAFYWWAYVHKEDVWCLADVGALVAAWFLALGRVANFVNAEILGKPFSGSWCVMFPNEEVCRHPVQLYAALKNVFLGSVLVLVHSTRSYTSGFIFWLFAALYATLRFFVQFLRDEPVLLLGLQTGHFLSLAVFAAAVYVLARWYVVDVKNLFKRV